MVNPNFSGAVGKELERCFAIPGFRGIKVHPELHGNYPLDGTGYRRMWEFANDLGIPVLAHTYFAGDDLDVFNRLANCYRKVPILLGHAGLDLGLDKAATLANGHANVWLELSGALRWDGLLERLVEFIEPAKLIFGSDMPFISGSLQWGGLFMARIPLADKELIGGLNAAKVFKVEQGSVGASRALL